MQHYDAIIIGTGQAGPALAQRLVDTGRTVAVIERKSFGGTCVNTGCIPTKTLVASAYAAHMARRAADFGVKIPCEILVDMKAVKARKDHVSGRSRNGVEQWVKNLKGCTVYQGHARLSGHIRSRLPARSSKPSGYLSMSEVAHWRRRSPDWTRSATSPTAR